MKYKKDNFFAYKRCVGNAVAAVKIRRAFAVMALKQALLMIVMSVCAYASMCLSQSAILPVVKVQTPILIAIAIAGTVGVRDAISTVMTAIELMIGVSFLCFSIVC